MLATFKLTPRSRKGKNKINNGLGDTVVAINKKGNRVLVAPIAEPSLRSKYVRWVELSGDPDFDIAEIVVFGSAVSDW